MKSNMQGACDKVAAVPQLVTLQLTAELQMLHSALILRRHCDWASYKATDPLPRAKSRAHGRTNEELRSLLHHLLQSSAAHDFAIEVPQLRICISRCQSKGKARNEVKLRKQLARRCDTRRLVNLRDHGFQCPVTFPAILLAVASKAHDNS